MNLPISIKGVCFIENKVLLLKNDRNEWELPGGRLNENEQPNETLTREFLEETGLSIIVSTILDSYIFEVIPHKNIFIVTYLCILSDTKNIITSDEHTNSLLIEPSLLNTIPIPAGYVNSIKRASVASPGNGNSFKVEIQTERLRISELTENDLNNIHELNSLPETDKYNTAGIPLDLEETKNKIYEWMGFQEKIPRNQYVLAISNTNNELIGIVGINIGKPHYRSAEIWYKLHPSQWNIGYGTEVVKSITHFCFTNLKLHRITAGCATENIASIKVLEKTGFTREGMHRNILPIRGKWIDNYEYAILEEDLPK